MKTPPKGRASRVEKRAVKTMGRAQKSWTKAEAVRKNTPSSDKRSNFAGDEFGRTGEQKAEQLYRRAARQEAKAKSQMEKAKYLREKSGVASKAGKAVGKMAAGAAAGSASTGKKQLMMKKTAYSTPTKRLMMKSTKK